MPRMGEPGREEEVVVTLLWRARAEGRRAGKVLCKGNGRGLGMGRWRKPSDAAEGGQAGHATHGQATGQ